MSGTHYFGEVVIVIGTALAVSWVFRIVRLPTILGFLITGIVIGPSGLQLIPEDDVSPFSELGLILLLFTIGLELSPKPLMRSARYILRATAVQVGATFFVVVAVLTVTTSMSLVARGVLGFAVALSSTAILLKQMSDHGEIGSPKGLISTGILLLQDILVILVLLAASLGSANRGATLIGGVLRAGGGLLGLGVIVVVAGKVLPMVLTQIARRGGRELITLFAVAAACGGAWVAGLAGWSPALGACVAGLLLARADEHHQLAADITPFRDLFNALFFISLGMSVELPVVFGHLPLLSGTIVATLVFKTVIVAVAVIAAGWPLRIGVQVGVAMCTVSEFSYVLVRQAHQMGVLPAESLEIMVAYAVGTMMLGALLYPLANPLARVFAGWFSFGDSAPGYAFEDATDSQADHVIVVGYGTTGANVARMLRATHLPHCVIEMNRALVKKARKDGETVIIGDATRMSILEHAGIGSARVLVTAANDQRATERIVAQVRARYPELFILVRARFADDIEPLVAKGASIVIPEDFETSIEVAAHVLKIFGVPDNIVEAQIAAVRTGGYGMLRGQPATRAVTAELLRILERTSIQTFFIADDASVCGSTLGQLNLRSATGCSVIAAMRKGQPMTNPGPDFRLDPNDVLVLVGAHAQIDAARTLLERTSDTNLPAEP